MALMKKLTSALVASSLVLSLVGTASATTPDKIDSAAKRMVDLGLLVGRGGSDGLALEANLTRAEMVTVIVRAFGQETNSKYLQGVAAFSDTATHWASGYIAMAKRLMEERGVTEMGYPDGTFRPQANVTAAEAVAFVMKAVGAPADNTLPWPDNYLQGALNAGIITAEDLAYLETVKNQPATRGLAFYLADSAFYGYKLANGSTVYRTFVDTIAPVLTLGEIPQTTLEPKVTVSGTATGAEAVYVNGQPAALTDGSFTAEVELALGENTITVTAVDLVGNTSEEVVRVTRTTGTATAIEASDITVAAGETIEVGATVVDAYGNALEAEITGESDVGTYADGKFTASTKAGEGTLTLKSGELTKTVKVTVVPGPLAKVEGEKVSVAPGEPLKLVAMDQYGNIVEGVTFSEDHADAVIDGDIFIATKAGKYTVKAVKDDQVVEGIIGVYGEAAKLVVTAPEKVVANDEMEYEFKVAAVDENGVVVGDYDKAITVTEYDLTPVDGKTEAYAEGGIATFKFTVPTELAGTVAELKFEQSDDSDIAGSIEVEILEQVATALELETSEDYLATNSGDEELTVKIIVKDQVGKEMKTGGWDFAIKVTGPAELKNGKQSMTEYFFPNSMEFKVYPTEAGEVGTVTITVTSEELGSATATVKAAIAKAKAAVTLKVNETSRTVDAPAFVDGTSLTPDNWFEFTVRVVDKNGVPTTEDDTLQVKFEGVTDTNYVYFSENRTDWVPLKDNESPVIKTEGGKKTFYVAGSVADTFKVSVVDPANALKGSESVEVTLQADEPYVVGFDTGSRVLRTAKNVSGELTAQLYDRFGNKLAVSGAKITLRTNNNDLKLNGKNANTAEGIEVTTDANGQAKVKVSAPGTISGDISVEIIGGKYGHQALAYRGSNNPQFPTEFRLDVHEKVTLTLKSALADSITLSFGTNERNYHKLVPNTGGTGNDPEPLTLTIKVEDEIGQPITDITAFKFEANDPDVEKFLNEVAVPTANGEDEYVYTVPAKKAGVLSITVTLPEYEASPKASKSVVIKAGDVAKFEVVEATDYHYVDETGTQTGKKIEVVANELTAFTIRLTDQWGNVASNDSVVRINIAVPDTLNLDELKTFDGEPAYLDVRNAKGASIKYVELKPWQNTAKFYVLTNAKGAVLNLSNDDKLDSDYEVLYVNPVE